mmetsp:Transcript_24372/g.57568  ORF Transcript_24372/g.57568 Transcript_24372/m.57568 type:complete len:311 (+) Transcript_24372:750-1682(+)
MLRGFTIAIAAALACRKRAEIIRTDFELFPTIIGGIRFGIVDRTAEESPAITKTGNDQILIRQNRNECRCPRFPLSSSFLAKTAKFVVHLHNRFVQDGFHLRRAERHFVRSSVAFDPQLAVYETPQLLHRKPSSLVAAMSIKDAKQTDAVIGVVLSPGVLRRSAVRSGIKSIQQVVCENVGILVGFSHAAFGNRTNLPAQRGFARLRVVGVSTTETSVGLCACFFQSRCPLRDEHFVQDGSLDQLRVGTAPQHKARHGLIDNVELIGPRFMDSVGLVGSSFPSAYRSGRIVFIGRGNGCVLRGLCRSEKR